MNGGTVVWGDEECPGESAGRRLGQTVADFRSLEAACTWAANDVIGHGKIIKTPFGLRRLIYADFTASGRSVGSIEDYLREVQATYGNVHSLSTTTARQSSFYREEARHIIKSYLNASAADDAVIFCGNGATSGVEKLINILNRADWKVNSRKDKKSIISETRWSTYYCHPCGVHLEDESDVTAHKNSTTHKEKNRYMEQIQIRLNAFLLDPTLHHSSFLPFKELRDYERGDDLRVLFCTDFLPYDPLTSGPSISGLKESLKRLLEVKKRLDSRIDLNLFVIMSGCSNVSGIKLPMTKVNSLIHNYGGISIWDLASALGHMKIDLNPPSDANGWSDITVMSPHKLLGGPDTVGILTMKKWLVTNEVPSMPGGGVVRFVSQQCHMYRHNFEQREEAGTPNILACIRTGLVFRLASLVPQPLAVSREAQFAEYLTRQWRKEKRIQLLGPLAFVDFGDSRTLDDATNHINNSYDLLSIRKAVISFVIKYGNDLSEYQPSSSSINEPSITHSVGPDKKKATTIKSYSNKSHKGGLYLHHNFVSALLNDLFGIQARPGCACAGPLSQDLLGLSENGIQEFKTCLEQTGCEVMRPGFVRISLNYSMTWDDVEIIAAAVKWVANFGWKLLPFYTFETDSGEWFNALRKPAKFRQWLSWMHFEENLKTFRLSFDPTTQSSDNNNGDDKRNSHSTRFKDPRKIAGAVALPGMSSAMSELKNTLLHRRANLRKQTAPGSVHTPPSLLNNDPAKKQNTISTEEALAPTVKAADDTGAKFRHVLKKKSTAPPGVLDQLTAEMRKSDQTELKQNYPASFEQVSPSILKQTNSPAADKQSSRTEQELASGGPQSSSKKGESSFQASLRMFMKGNDNGSSGASAKQGNDSSNAAANGSDQQSKRKSWRLGRSSGGGDLNSSGKSSADGGTNETGATVSANDRLKSETGKKKVPLLNTEAVAVGSGGAEKSAPDSARRLVGGLNKLTQKFSRKDKGSPSMESPRPVMEKKEQLQPQVVPPSTGPEGGQKTKGKPAKSGDMNSKLLKPSEEIDNDEVANLFANRTGEDDETAPEDLEDFYRIANRLVDAVTSDSDGRVERHLLTNKNSLSVPLPMEFSHLLWFALPGDAAASLALFSGGRQQQSDSSSLVLSEGPEQEPRVVLSTHGLGAPCWYSFSNSSSQKIVKRIKHAPFEPKYFHPKDLVKFDQVLQPAKSTGGPKPNDFDVLRTWALFQAVANLNATGNASRITAAADSRGHVPTNPLVMAQTDIVGLPSSPLVESNLKKTTEKKSPDNLSTCVTSAVDQTVAGGGRSADRSEQENDDRDLMASVNQKDEYDAILIRKVSSFSVLNVNNEQKSSRKSTSGTHTPAADSDKKDSESIDDDESELKKPSLSSSNIAPGGTLIAEPTTESEEASLIDPAVKAVVEKVPRPLVVPKTIRRFVGEAIKKFNMIENGDRILLGLSGGKDSLSLLHVLLDLQRRSGIKFDVAAATVNPNIAEYDPSPLASYLKELNVDYFMLKYPIVELAKEKMQGDSLCSFCARMKRGLLYGCMKTHNYNKLALGQHLDDIAESFLMSLFYNGCLNTMKAHYAANETGISIIRPLILTREKELAAFAETYRLPVIADNCPACFSGPKERLRMKLLLSKQEFEFPHTLSSISKALIPLMDIKRVGPAANVVAIAAEQEKDESVNCCTKDSCALG